MMLAASRLRQSQRLRLQAIAGVNCKSDPHLSPLPNWLNHDCKQAVDLGRHAPTA